ncbi:hypothetical protein [Pontibacter cellulosilyticus]|uniref:Uncharacterized protein n=1 Tax=Pontibacter cellulosilyticus TaxID=1720253 RepID=A0A923N8Z2_9BACT|nr:hypothetical protein [Pontibacter cellulosilyticus]MBC5993914.1 hypothetical protein [Pontibacter cellulosilyticus]
MKKILIVSVLSASMGLGLSQQPSVAAPVSPLIADVSTANVHPTEAKYDKIMAKYATGIKAAFAEKDDKKTVALVNKMNNELVSELEKIKPELERWMKGMTEKDKEGFEQRMGEKAYFKTIFEIMFDPAVGARIEKNPELKQALEAGNQKMEGLGFKDEDSEEEEID